MIDRFRRIPLLVCTALVLVALALPTVAQEEEAASGLMADFLNDYGRVSERLVSLAKAVPAEKYSWRPSEGVRSVSEVYMHATGVNFLMPAGLGAMPADGMQSDDPMATLRQLEAEVTAKDDVIAKLEASVAYAKKAIMEVAESGLEEQSELFGFPATKRAYLLILLTHAHEHLGQSIAYARSNGVVPPWSQQQAGDEGGN